MPINFRLTHRSLVMLAILVGVGSSDAAASEHSWQTRRVELRSGRNQLRSMAIQDAKLRADADATIVAGLVDLAEQTPISGQKSKLLALANQIEWLDAESAKGLLRRINSLGPEPAAAAEEDVTDWQQALSTAEEELVKRPGELLNRSVELGSFDLAHQFIQEIFAFAPSHRGLRASLGHKLHDDQWVSTFKLNCAERGLSWDDRWGWYRKADAARYEAGEFFDQDRQEWTTLEIANRQHQSLDDPWTLRTEHLTLTGTIELGELAKVAARLETFYQQVFAEYAAFFARTPQDYKLVLGMANHPPLSIRLFRDTKQFGVAYPRRPKWSKGIFDPITQTSFFVGTSEHVMYHEFTHQILHVFAHGNRSPAWLTEGIAVYTQSPSYLSGRLVLGVPEQNPSLQKHFAAFNRNEHMSLNEVLAIEDLARWGATAKPDPQYWAAGSLVQFCMEAKDRSFRADFIDFLSDSYRGRTQGHPLWEYLGLDKEIFAEFYQDWLRSASTVPMHAKPAELTRQISASPLQLLTGVTAIGVLLQETADEAKLPQPDLAAQQEALDVIRKEVYAGDYKRATSRTGKISLSDKLYREGTETLDDDAARFVLLREATQMAGEGGDVDRAFRFIDETARLYQVKPLELKVEALATGGKSAEAVTAQLAIANHALTLIGTAAAENEYDLARRIGELGLVAADRIDNRGLQQQIQSRLREIDRVRNEYASVKASVDLLKNKPDDPTANAAVGKYYCFIRGDWAVGLPMLVKGNDPQLRELATIELSAPSDPPSQVKLGDAWWKLGREASEPTKTHAQARAAHWYQSVVPRLSGLTKSKIQERLKQLERDSKKK